MGFFKSPFKKLKKVAKVAKKLDPIGSKIAEKTSPFAKKLLSDDKSKRLYPDADAVRESTRGRAADEETTSGGRFGRGEGRTLRR